MTLSEWMEASGLQAVDVAKASGVPNATLSRFLRRKNDLSAKNIELIVRYTRGKVTFEDIMRESRDASPRAGSKRLPADRPSKRLSARHDATQARIDFDGAQRRIGDGLDAADPDLELSIAPDDGGTE